jgi:hypothetical protein
MFGQIEMASEIGGENGKSRIVASVMDGEWGLTLDPSSQHPELEKVSNNWYVYAVIQERSITTTGFSEYADQSRLVGN